MGFEQYYEISNFGRVRILATGKIFTRSVQWYSSGYPSFYPHRKIIKDKELPRKALAIHVQVMRAFVGECPDGMEIDHIDGNRNNSRLDNLEYVTHSENIRRMHANKKKGITRVTFASAEWKRKHWGV